MATNWNFDPSHSELEFKIRHMMISNVKGRFEKFTAEMNGDSLENAVVTATIDTASISTNNAERDTHLKSADFFDAETYPNLSFKSTSIKKDGDDYKVTGDLTMRDITKEIVLDVEYGGLSKDPWGNEKAGYSFSTKLNRKDWGLNWNAALETGGLMVSEEVKINGEVQFVKKS